MVNLNELLDERRHKIKSLQDLAERISSDDRNFTDDEKQQQDELEREIRDLDALIEDRKEQEDRLKRIQEQTERLTQRASERRVPAVHTGGGVPERAAHRMSYKRYGKMQAYREGEEDQAYRDAMWLFGTMGDDKARRWCDRHDIECRAMSEGVNSKGGVLVPEELSQRIIDLRENYGVFRQNAYIEPMGGDVKTITRETSGLTAYFVGEGSSITESDSTWDTVKLVAKKLAVSTRVSSELTEDAAISIVDRFAMDTAKALAEKEDQCGFNGDGTSTYGGINGACKIFEDNATTYAGASQVTNIDKFNEVTNAHLTDTMALLPGYVTSPKWYCSRAAWAALFQRLALAGGGNTIQTIEGGYGLSYLGFPIVITQVMQTSTGEHTSCFFLFGDLSLAATMGDRRGITIAQSEHKYWSTDEIALKATERLDINCHNLGDTTTAGPVVAMVAH